MKTVAASELDYFLLFSTRIHGVVESLFIPEAIFSWKKPSARKTAVLSNLYLKNRVVFVFTWGQVLQVFFIYYYDRKVHVFHLPRSFSLHESLEVII